MIVTPDQLQNHLTPSKRKPAYLVFGDEPLQVMESLDIIRQHLRDLGATERIVLEVERGFDWDDLGATLSGMSLFAEQRIIEVKLGDRKPDKKGVEKIETFLTTTGSDDTLLVSANKLDRNQHNAKWFKALERHGLVVQGRQLSGRALESWIVTRAKKADIQIGRDVADLIATRAEGNMLAAAQELEKLALANPGQTIDSKTALASIADSARYDVFKLMDSVMNGQTTHVVRMLRGLREEGTEPIIINWALNKELRTLYEIKMAVQNGSPSSRAIADAGIWSSRTNLVEKLLRRKNLDALRYLFLQSISIDRMIKGALAGNPWDEMEMLCVALSGG